MKRIGIFLENEPYGGGAFQYNQAILEALNSLNPKEYSIYVLYKDDVWKDYLKQYSFNTKKIKQNKLNNIFCGIIRRCMRYLGININSLKRYYSHIDFLSRQIDGLNTDLMIFPGQEMIAARINTDSISVIHDLMHRYEKFPEIISNGQYSQREYKYKNICESSKIVFVDSVVGKDHVIECYGEVYNEKIKILPFTIPQYLYKNNVKNVSYTLPDKFIFYPAQFWQHKNHLNLLKAISLLKQKGIFVNIVLVGSKKNGYENVCNYVESFMLKSQVLILGYVSDGEMALLYRKARALIMPTFCGPTNIPPLEGMALGCPTAVSNVYAMPWQIQNAGLIFDPYDVSDIADKIESLWTNDKLCMDLRAKGLKRVQYFSQERFNARFKRYIKAFFEYSS